MRTKLSEKNKKTIDSQKEKDFDDKIRRMFDQLLVQNRWISLVGSLFFYLISSFLLFPLSPAAGTYLYLPVFIVLNVSFGLPGGIISGLIYFITHFCLFQILVLPDWHSLILPSALLILIGIPLGRITQTIKRNNSKILKQADVEIQLRNMLAERDLLLKEVNHRVKNNLALMKSLIQLQQNRLPSPELQNEYAKLQQRLQSMALVHETLFDRDPASQIELSHYLQSLASSILKASSEKIQLIIRIPDAISIPLSPNTASYIGLILNELLINSIKYAFEGITDPKITLSLSLKDANVLITIQDNGRGCSACDQAGLGLTLVKAIAMHLKGDFIQYEDEGLGSQLTLPISET